MTAPCSGPRIATFRCNSGRNRSRSTGRGEKFLGTSKNLKTFRAIAVAALLFWTGISTARAQTIRADRGSFTPQMANDVAAILRGQYGRSTIDESAFSLQGSNYITLEGLVGTSPN